MTPTRTPRHILCVLHSLGRGGTENGVVNLVNRTDPARFRFTLAVTQEGTRDDARSERSMLERVQRPDVRVVSVRRRWGNDPLYPASLYALCRRERPDLVHTRNFSCIEGLAAARLAGVRATVHSEHGRDADEAHGFKRRRAVLRSVLYRCARRVVTVSQELRDSVLAQVDVPPAKVECIPNGVDLARFDAAGASSSRERVRRDLGIGPDEVVVGSVGRHDPVKDYRSLLRAFAGLSDGHCLGEEPADARRSGRAPARLLLCGDGPQNADLRRAAREMGIAGRVIFTGARDDVARVLAAVDVFVLPSLTEGMSNAILEAMASSLPVVATQVGGNGELVSHGGSGLLVPPGSEAALRDGIRALVRCPDLRVRMGRVGRLRAEHRFSLDRMVARYEDLYELLITGRSRSESRQLVRSPETPACARAPRARVTEPEVTAVA